MGASDPLKMGRRKVETEVNVFCILNFSCLKDHSTFKTIVNCFRVKLKQGKYQLKFIVDGEWRCSSNLETVTDDNGNTNNILTVEAVTNVDDETNEAENEGMIKSQTKTETENKDVMMNHFEAAHEDNIAPDSLESGEDKVTDYLTEVKESSEEASMVTLKWSGLAESVLVAGEFSNWQPLTMSEYQKGLWQIQLKLKPGSYQLRFLVDGKDRLSEYMETVINESEETFNKIHVEIVKEALIDNNVTDSNRDIMHATNVNDLTITDAKDVNYDSEIEHTRAAHHDDDEVTDVNIQWKGSGDSVMVSGEFSNWSGISLSKTQFDIWSVKLRLKFGEYLMLFFVDGEIVLSEDMEKIYSEQDEDTYNVLKVKKNASYDEEKSKFHAKPSDRKLENSLEISYDENQADNLTSLCDHDDDDTDANNDACENEIAWTGFANNVCIIGDFSNWTPISLSNQGGDDWRVTLKLSEGPHLIKFIVDEKFTLSEMMEKVIGPDQEVYNLVHAGTNNSQKYEIR